MRRYFNTEGICDPEIHYMVRLDERLKKIRQRYVERGSYFVINRGRQYGKTTTLRLLANYLQDDYFVLFLDFQELSSSNFESEARFVDGLVRCFVEAMDERQNTDLGVEERERYISLLRGQFDMGGMFDRLSKICELSEKPVVLMIDEVDSASNNQVFIDFLAFLRRYYLNRTQKPIFHSVVLAGVYDIKNLKLKLRPDSEHQYNSPWNIAAKFNIDMSFSVDEIASMLREYEEDNQTGMDIEKVAKNIYEYTSGYPYLVSAICKYLDEDFPERKKPEDGCVWSEEGISEAVKNILSESAIPLFDSMVKQLDTFSDLRKMIEEILYQGKKIPFSPYVRSVNLGVMFGFLKEEDGHVAVANRIFEMGLLNMFMTEEAAGSEAFRYGQRDKNQLNSFCCI